MIKNAATFPQTERSARRAENAAVGTEHGWTVLAASVGVGEPEGWPSPGADTAEGPGRRSSNEVHVAAGPQARLAPLPLTHVLPR